MKRLMCCFVLSAVALFADVTGKWSGTGKATSSDGDTQVMTLSMELKQNGNDITGTVMTGDSGDRYSLSGTVDGDVLNLKVETDQATYVVKLTLNEDHLKGEATADQGGAKVTVQLEFKREAS